MCIRTVFWEDSAKNRPEKSIRSLTEPLVCEYRSQAVPEKSSLPPVLEGILDFVKGISGFKPSTT